MELVIAVRMLRRRLQNNFIPRSFLAALQIIVLLVIFRFLASTAIDCNGFAAMNRFKHPKNHFDTDYLTARAVFLPLVVFSVALSKK